MIRIFLAAALAFAAGTPCIASPPEPAASAYLVTEVGGFKVERGKGVLYDVVFAVQEPLTSAMYATVEFENPEPGGPLLRSEQTIEAGATQLAVHSAPIKRIKIGSTYTVSVTLFSDSERTHAIGTHVQPVLFNLPEAVMRAFGVEPL